MPVTVISVTGLEEAQDVLRRLHAAIPAILADRREKISDMLLRRIDKRWETRRTEKGVPWRNLRAGFWPRRSGRLRIYSQDRRRILQDTGLLRRSIRRLQQAAGGRINVGGRSVYGFEIGVVGAAKEYAHVHQFGLTRSPITGGIIPRRRFLGVNKKDAELTAEIVVKELRAVVAGKRI